MMKGAIAYYSTTGNTLRVCETIRRRIASARFDLIDVASANQPDFSGYDIVGFATFADELRAPALMEDFIARARADGKRAAFLVNTYGSISGRTLPDLVRSARRAGYRVIGAFSVHAPENYPPMIKKGLGFADRPSARELDRLGRDIGKLALAIEDLSRGKNVPTVRESLLSRIAPLPPRFLSRLELGAMRCDARKCARCMNCARECPSRAIFLDADGNVSIDQAKCAACWKCFNRCPTGAFYGSRFGTGPRYRSVHPAFAEKLESLADKGTSR